MHHDFIMDKINIHEELLRTSANDWEMSKEGEETCEAIYDRFQSVFAKEDKAPPEISNSNGIRLGKNGYY